MKLTELNLRISWSAIGLFYILSTLAVPLALASPSFLLTTFFVQLLVGLAISAITTLFLCSLFYIKEVTDLKHFSVWIIVLGVVGSIRGFLIVVFVDLFGLEDPASFTMRIINSIVNTCFWVTVFSILIESSRKFRTNYQEQLKLLLKQIENVEDVHRKDVKYLEKQVDYLNSLAKQTLQSKNIDETQTGNLRNTLLSQINEVLKPMSYKLWKGDPLLSPRVKFRHAVFLALKNLEFSFTKVFFVIAMLGFINGLSIFGASRSLFRLFIFLSCWSIVHYIFQKKLKTSKSVSFNILYLIAAGVLPVFVTEIVNQFMGFDYNLRSSILFMPVLPILICIYAFQELISKERDKLIEKLQELTGGNLSDLHRLTTKRVELGGYLHNSLQSELLAMSMQLDRAKDAQDLHLTKSTIERLHSYLTNVLNNEFSEREVQLNERLKRIQEGWEGIASIEFEFENLSQLYPSDQIKLIQICEEIITNSVRQGGASIVQIRGSIIDNKFEIKLKSNGELLNPSQSNPEFSWLSFLLENSWKLKVSDGDVIGEGRFHLN